VEKLQLLRTEQDNERVLAEVWQLMEKGEKNLTPVITRGCGAQEESNTSLESAFQTHRRNSRLLKKLVDGHSPCRDSRLRVGYIP
jgi:hypothetical protein